MALGLREIVRRLGYHQPSPATIDTFEAVRHRFIELALFVDETLPEGRMKAETHTNIQYALMTAISAVAYEDEPQGGKLPRDMPPGWGERGDGLPPGATLG
jgi:hypothetical protein